MEGYGLITARKAARGWNCTGAHLNYGCKLQRQNQNHQHSLQHLSLPPRNLRGIVLLQKGYYSWNA